MKFEVERLECFFLLYFTSMCFIPYTNCRIDGSRCVVNLSRHTYTHEHAHIHTYECKHKRTHTLTHTHTWNVNVIQYDMLLLLPIFCSARMHMCLSIFKVLVAHLAANLICQMQKSLFPMWMKWFFQQFVWFCVLKLISFAASL